jgi:hypothetical protein
MNKITLILQLVILHVERIDYSHFYYFSIKGENSENTIKAQNPDEKTLFKGGVTKDHGTFSISCKESPSRYRGPVLPF